MKGTHWKSSTRCTTFATVFRCKHVVTCQNKADVLKGRGVFKKGGSTDKKWIQKAINPAHKGYCTPMTKPTCTPKRKALAKTLKKIAKNK